MNPTLPDPIDLDTDDPPRLRWSECLGKWSKLTAAVYVLLALLAHMPALVQFFEDPLEPSQSGEFLGAVMGTFLLACLLSWVAYLISRRGSLAASGTFITVLVFLSLGQLGTLAERGGNHEVMQDFDRVVDRQRAANIDLLERSIRGEEVADPIQQLDQYAGELDRISTDLRGDDAGLMRAAATVVRSLEAPSARYHAAYDAFEAAGGIDASTLRDRESCVARLALIDDFARANDDLDAAVEKLESTMRAELNGQGITGARANQFMNGWKRSANIALLQSIRETDRQLAAAFGGMVQHLHDHMYQWTIDANNEIVFRDDSAADEYDRFWYQMNDAAEEQTRLQQRLVDLMRAKGQP